MFGERLKALRLAKGISQEELGKRLGVTKQTVSNWEIENVTPALDMFQSIVRYFDTTPNYMLGYEIYVGVDVTGLTEKEIAHIMLLVEDLRARHEESE